MTKAKIKKAKKVKVLKVPDKTRNSAALKQLKWKLRDVRIPGRCIKADCGKTGVQGLFCKKHKKILRKRQLKLNNIPWRKKKAKKGYVPDQPHVLYAGAATAYTLKDKKKALARVKAGNSILKSVKELEAAIAKRLAKKAVVAKSKPASKPAPKPAGKSPTKPLAKPPPKKVFKKPEIKTVTKVKVHVKKKAAKEPVLPEGPPLHEEDFDAPVSAP